MMTTIHRTQQDILPFTSPLQFLASDDPDEVIVCDLVPMLPRNSGNTTRLGVKAISLLIDGKTVRLRDYRLGKAHSLELGKKIVKMFNLTLRLHPNLPEYNSNFHNFLMSYSAITEMGSESLFSVEGLRKMRTLRNIGIKMKWSGNDLVMSQVKNL